MVTEWGNLEQLYGPRAAHIGQLFAILSKYFDALESGKLGRLHPVPNYVWKYYKGEMTLKRIREAWEGIDSYLSAFQQINWVNTHKKIDAPDYTAGSGLNRLPDPQLWAMMQEIDTLLAGLGYVPDPPPRVREVNPITAVPGTSVTVSMPFEWYEF